MSDIKLGQLTRVDLRKVWANEAGDFSPWLAQAENLALLAETLHLDGLELDRTEVEVGPYRADIVCQEAASDRVIVIENQLEKTDHDHLGKLLTYAAGLKAEIVVWVAARFTDEHRAAAELPMIYELMSSLRLSRVRRALLGNLRFFQTS